MFFLLFFACLGYLGCKFLVSVCTAHSTAGAAPWPVGVSDCKQPPWAWAQKQNPTSVATGNYLVAEAISRQPMLMGIPFTLSRC